jgi:hypothetical protein
MRVRFNPHRAALLALLVCGWMLVLWLGQHASPGHVHGTLPALDQKHAIAALAIIGITVVGLFKLWIRRR